MRRRCCDSRSSRTGMFSIIATTKRASHSRFGQCRNGSTGRRAIDASSARESSGSPRNHPGGIPSRYQYVLGICHPERRPQPERRISHSNAVRDASLRLSMTYRRHIGTYLDRGARALWDELRAALAALRDGRLALSLGLFALLLLLAAQAPLH